MRLSNLVLFMWASFVIGANGSTTPITNFTDLLPGGFVVDEWNTNVIAPITIGDFVITPNVDRVSGAFGATAPTTPEAPGDSGGILFNGFDCCTPLTSLILDFSEPVTGFGVTFQHFSNMAYPIEYNFPAFVYVYDGPNGTGNMLGFLSSSGGTGVADFVGLYSDTKSIKSARLTGTPPFYGVAADAFGILIEPVPEPSSIVMSGLGTVLLLALRRRLHGKATES